MRLIILLLFLTSCVTTQSFDAVTVRVQTRLGTPITNAYLVIDGFEYTTNESGEVTVYPTSDKLDIKVTVGTSSKRTTYPRNNLITIEMYEGR